MFALTIMRWRRRSMVKLTDRAVAEILRVAAENDLEGPVFLRAGVRGGGCSGFQYTLDMTDEDGIRESDERFEHGSDGGKVTVVVDSKSNLYLDGTTIDFKEDMMQRGFSFDNPNASGCCGCGQSFSC